MEARGACLTALKIAVHYLSQRCAALLRAPTLLSPRWEFPSSWGTVQDWKLSCIFHLAGCIAAAQSRCRNKRGATVTFWGSALCLSCSSAAVLRCRPFVIRPVTRFQSSPRPLPFYKPEYISTAIVCFWRTLLSKQDSVQKQHDLMSSLSKVSSAWVLEESSNDYSI